MQTRHKSARRPGATSASPVPAHRQRTRRSARQAAALDARLGTGSAPRDGKRGSLVRDPPPRRGAPPASAAGVAKFVETGGHAGQEDQDDGDDDQDDSDESDAVREVRGDEEETQRLMTRLLPDLVRATRELMERLSSQASESRDPPGFLETKRTVFMIHRECYLEHGTASIFIDWNKPGPLHNLAQADASVIGHLAKTNVTALLDYIRRIETAKGNFVKRAFLSALDSSFPHLFQSPSCAQPCPDLLLKIRTCYLIETLPRLRTKAQAQEAIAHVFCETAQNNDYGSLCENGPYRTLGRGDGQGDERCKHLIASILTSIGQARKKLGLESLRQSYQLEVLLGELSRWCLEMYEALLAEPGPESRPEGQPDAEGSVCVPGDQDSASDYDAEDTVRVDKTILQPTMFQGASSVQALEATRNCPDAHRPLHPPPSGERSRVPPSPSSERSRVLPPPTNGPPRVPQRVPYTHRRHWSKHDTDLLLQAIDRCDTYYAEIERSYQDRFECPRGQQAYRDKARSLKVDILLNDGLLPTNFDNVSLGAKERRALERAGKNPDRRESDVDASGAPTKTVWRG